VARTTTSDEGRAGRGRRDGVLRLLSEDGERLETGLTRLDAELPLDESVTVDLLACDAVGHPVVALLCGEDSTAVLGRMAAIAASLQRGRHLLGRLYGPRGLDASLRPRFVLLSRRFSDELPALLDMLGSLEVRALEYRVVASPEGRPILDLASFHRTAAPAERRPPRSASSGRISARADASAGRSSGVASASAPSSARRAAAAPAASRRDDDIDEGVDLLPDVDAPDALKRLFLRAWESIRSLSSLVTDSGENGRLSFHVDDVLLATLVLDETGFAVHVGDDVHAVRDDETFNESLNAVFARYFDRIAAGD